ncbi:hypothetical protein COU89_00585 [Candidatus Roizmanbacteria bacterium CG10_big_fil_rev_8_21_14_0_10_45_7]|uniref:BioF2-like acetyltransferase domain-containing protein n=1 Tax=Candidatus Roizmanbacteria bacterium CG10_big_fil_rev_8_21_14_0_10_45_7 TaxID=1974854 RepID=A0A2M8KVJ0_9BACT|nr:MAG: hypothetical protein COU89_00585 [Candidatus Roizmanbacteria bacterium CG10_big_fil_rev_8_21_14_0_10_45_7]
MNQYLYTNQLLSPDTTTEPYPIHILNKKPWHAFIRTNGYRALAKKLRMQVVTDMETAEQLWQIFTPNKSLFDLWEFRKAFAENFAVDPYFITLYEQIGSRAHILGILPLWLDNDEYAGKYTWFGGFWPEDNTFFVKDPEFIPLMLMAAPKPLILDCIIQDKDYEFLNNLAGFTTTDDKKYYLNTSSFKSVDDYLITLKKKKRQNIRRDKKRISLFNPHVAYGRMHALDRMFSLNIERMNELNKKGYREKSCFEDVRYKHLFRSVTTCSTRIKPMIITTDIGNQTESIELGAIYNKTYYAFISGTNIKDYSGLGVYSNLLVIEEAIKQGCNSIDFLSGNYNWKESWQLDAVPLYKFTK